MVKNLPAIQETWVLSLGQENPLEKGMATHSSILVWKIPWTEEPGVLQSMGSQRVGDDWATNTFTPLSQKPLTIKGKTDKFNYNKSLNFCIAEDTINKIKQMTDWNYILNIKMLFYSYTSLRKQINRKWANDLYQDSLSICKWPINWFKKCSNLTLRNMQVKTK